MAYYLAPSLGSLRNEVNTAHPKRDKTSDGWIGDASHAARASDHNPDYASGGVVRAIDIDHDGINKAKLLAVAIADPRTEYVIQDGFIYLRSTGFKKQVYTGTNKHDKHTHISIRHTKTAEKSGKWGYTGGVVKSVVKAPATAPARKPVSVIAKEVIAGNWGDGTTRSQKLTAAGYSPTQVQAEVNRLLGAKTVARPSVSLLATQVIAGQWGNGLERQRRLTSAGFDAKAVQAEINRRLLKK